MEECTIPHCFEKYRLDDELRALAYENANAVHKAGIKSAIALHFSLIEEFFPHKKQCAKSAFALKCEKFAPLSSCFIFACDFSSPALFIAAIMPALLAKSPLVLVFRHTPHEDILLCLELLGLEQVFYIDEQEALLDCLAQMRAEKIFNCFYFGTKGKDEVEKFALQHSLCFYTYSSNPLVFAGKNKELFEKIYPNAQIYVNSDDVESIDGSTQIHIYSQSAINDNNTINSQKSLILGDGLEFYHEILFDEKYFVKEQKFYTFAD